MTVSKTVIGRFGVPLGRSGSYLLAWPNPFARSGFFLVSAVIWDVASTDADVGPPPSP